MICKWFKKRAAAANTHLLCALEAIIALNIIGDKAPRDLKAKFVIEHNRAAWNYNRSKMPWMSRIEPITFSLPNKG